MKDNRCFICKYKQENIPKTNDDLIYDTKGNSMVVPLCYGHSVELFKFGQKVFLSKHKYIFSGSFGIENDIELMKYFNPDSRERFWY